MKASLTLAAALLAASPAIAGLIPFHGILPGTPGKRDLGLAGKISERAACNEDNVLRALQNPTRSVGASTFCSAYLQPTTVVTATATISQTAVITSTSTATISTTVSTTVTTSIIELCAATPTGPITCGYPAYGYEASLISSTPYTDPVTCHQLCLQDPNCESFQIESDALSYCNLHNVPTSGNVDYAPGDVYTFYDRDCSQYLPPTCTPNPSPKKRDIEARAATTPANLSTILATVPASRISSACSCLITSASATTTITVPALTTAFITKTTTAVVTTTGTELDISTAIVTSFSTASP